MAEAFQVQAKPEAGHRSGYYARQTVAVFATTLALAACTPKSHESAPSSSATSLPSSAPTALKTSPPTATHSPSPTERSESPSGEGLAGCKPYFDLSKYHDHEYEVCTAYVANSAEIALQGLYKFGNSRYTALADTARHHFETRYWDGPRQTIEHEVDSWPKTWSVVGNEVDQSVDILSVTSDLKADRGLVHAQENWEVMSPDGSLLYSEPSHNKDITLCRGKLPGHILHEWVVVSFTANPTFDCIAFDTAHSLEP
jgi:hypothetical protein